jgi:23S rRNA pseudouridine2605 synthase
VKPVRDTGRLSHRNPKVSLARAISKQGFCSRTKAQSLILEGRVRVNGSISRDPERRVDFDLDRIEMDDLPISSKKKIYILLNKPRGLVVTTSDEQGRATVYSCFRAEKFPWIAPVGRLDKASEGLLLFTNDTRWAARILDPETHLEKVYHVQINQLAKEDLIRQIREGTTTADGDFLSAREAKILRRGARNCWLEIILDEGKNRHIRRLLAAHGVDVLRLVRVAIGPLILGKLAKGAYQHLTKEEVEGLFSFPRKCTV